MDVADISVLTLLFAICRKNIYRLIFVKATVSKIEPTYLGEEKVKMRFPSASRNGKLHLR